MTNRTTRPSYRPRRRGRGGVRVAVVGLVVAVVGIVSIAVAGGDGHNIVYTLAAVQVGRTQHPRAWAGRSVLVRGRITVAYALQSRRGVIWWLPTDCAAVSACLSDRQIRAVVPRGADLHLILRSEGVLVPGRSALLVLSPPPPDARFAALARLPLIGRLLPRPSDARWGAATIYRIRVLPAHPASCQPLACDDGQLLGVMR